MRAYVANVNSIYYECNGIRCGAHICDIIMHAYSARDIPMQLSLQASRKLGGWGSLIMHRDYT